jgi:hypothetical protein
LHLEEGISITRFKIKAFILPHRKQCHRKINSGAGRAADAESVVALDSKLAFVE